MTTTIETTETTVTQQPKARRKRSLKAVTPKEPLVPTAESPKEHLRDLVRQHQAASKLKVATTLRITDRKMADGTVQKSLLPDDLIADIKRKRAPGDQREPGILTIIQESLDGLERKMTAALKEVPIYKHFLKDVFGVGPVAASYLIAYVDIHRATKVSQLHRYCGMAVIDGRLERMTSKEVRKYNSALRVKLFSAFAAMWKNGARYTVCTHHAELRPKSSAKSAVKAEFRRVTAACPDCQKTANPYGQTCKYLDIWRGKKHGYESTGRKGGHKAGWHVAARVLLEDMYTVWRTLEGLDVWPSYYAAVRGHIHGGKVCVNRAEMLTLDEALALVGDVGGRPATAPVLDEEPDMGELEDVELEAAAE